MLMVTFEFSGTVYLKFATSVVGFGNTVTVKVVDGADSFFTDSSLILPFTAVATIGAMPPAGFEKSNPLHGVCWYGNSALNVVSLASTPVVKVSTSSRSVVTGFGEPAR